MSVQVAPPLASSPCNRQPVCGVAPLLPRSWLHCFRGAGSPPILFPSGPSDCFPASPQFPQSSGYTGRRILESPRFSRPSALPCLNPRVAPFFRPCGNASDRFVLEFPQGPPGFPGPLDLPVVPKLAPRVTPDLRSPRLPPMAAYSSCPESLCPRCCRRCVSGLPRFLQSTAGR